MNLCLVLLQAVLFVVSGLALVRSGLRLSCIAGNTLIVVCVTAFVIRRPALLAFLPLFLYLAFFAYTLNTYCWKHRGSE